MILGVPHLDNCQRESTFANMFVIRSVSEHSVSSTLLLIHCSAKQAEVTSSVPTFFSFADSEMARPALGRCQRRHGKSRGLQV